MALLNNKGYKWNFENIGGTTRVKITTGDDLRHLAELDPKMWTVLSCPVKGLEIDEKSLAYMDCDGDGKLRVNDVICTSRWVTGAVKDADLLLAGKDSIDIENINQEDACGGKLYAAARQVLMNLGKGGSVISLADTADSAAIFAKTRFNGDGVIIEASAEGAEEKAAIAAAVAATGGTLDRSGVQGVNAAQIEDFYKALADYAAWKAAEVEAPYGDQTDKAVELYSALDAKIKDFFVRSKLAAFSPDSTASLDVQTAQIQAISAENLTGKTADIAAYPIARVDGKAQIDLSAPVNPAWTTQFDALCKIAVDPAAKVLTEDDWAAIGAKFAAYAAWKAAKAGACVESLGLETVQKLLAEDRKTVLLDLVAQDAALSEEAANIALVDKFLHVFRDFYRLVRNFVTFHDFYDKDRTTLAIFQSGVLMIDQRACHFCMNVADAGKHNAMAPSSGMYLVYCDCTTKSVAGKISIVAAVTVGEVGDLMVGKNAIYYDNKGVEWDAVITKIVDNPISISQAFWSPYRRMATAVENLISKNAADKDAKMMKDATAKINAAPASLPAGGTALSPETDRKVGEAFDIGKFAGIFAALGMAVGMIGTALASIAKGIFALKWWQVIMAFVGVMLVISGPAVVMAWLKLRRRNIAPLLNANGWAVNASSKISILFGETLTDIAKYPKLKLKDPYARKGLAPWKKWAISLSALVVVAAGLWLGNLLKWVNLPSPLPWFNKTEVVEEVPVCECAADTVEVSVPCTEVVVENE